MNSEDKDVEVYYINGTQYVNVAELAMAVAGTEKAFDVSFDAATGEMKLISGTDYSGAEVKKADAQKAEDLTEVPSGVVMLDDIKQSAQVYAMNDVPFVKLGNIVSLLNLNVSIDPSYETIYFDTSRVILEDEESDVSNAIPAEYTKKQTVHFEPLNIDVTIAMDDAETKFYMPFTAFGHDQLVYGTLNNGEVEVEHDETGFFTKDAPAFIALVDPNAWEANVVEGGIPADYTKVQTVHFEPLNIDVTIGVDEDETKFYMMFNAFGDDQLLYGTLNNGELAVEYDKTGFFTKDAPAFMALTDPEKWGMNLSAMGVPGEYTKYQTVHFDPLDIDVNIAMNDDESKFYIFFNAFGDDQVISGTMANGEPTVEYDKTGFFTKDAPVMLSLIDANAWK